MKKIILAACLASIGACSQQASAPTPSTNGTFVGLATVFKGDIPHNTLVLGMSHSLTDCNDKVVEVMKAQADEIPEGLAVIAQCVEVKGPRVEGHAVPRTAPVEPQQ